MIPVLGVLTLLVTTNLCAGAIKGGRIIQEPAFIQDIAAQPQVLVSKGGLLGGGGAVVSPFGGGIKTSGLGAGSTQLSIDGGVFGNRGLYRVGPASYPYGLTGLDYFSYPNSLLTSPRLLGGKTISSPNLSGFSPIGLAGGRGGVIVDPVSQFGIGDSQVKTVLGGRGLYRSGLSSVPFGLLGSDYYSYPKNLLLQRSIDPGFGQAQILTGGSAFPASSPLGGIAALGAGAQQVAVLDDGAQFGQQKVTTTTITESADPFAAALGERQITTVTKSAGGGLGGLRGGNILLRGGPALGLRRVKSGPVIASAGPAAVVIQDGLAPAIGGFGQRQVAITKSAPIVAAPTPILPAPVISPIPVAAAPIFQAPVFARPAAPIVSAPILARPAAPILARPAAPIIQAPVFARPAAPIVQAPVLARPAAPIIQTPVFARPAAPIVQAPVFARPAAPIIQPPVFARPAAPIVQTPVFARPVAAPIVQAPVIARAAAPVIQAPVYTQPAAPILTAAPRTVIARRPVNAFLSQVARPRITYAQPAPIVSAPVVAAAPVIQQRVVSPVATAPNFQFTLGGNQLIGGPVVSSAPYVSAAPRQVVVAAAPRPAIVNAAPRQVVVAAAPRPTIVAAAPRPVVVAAAPRPVVVAAAPRPVVVAAAPRPVVVAAAPRPVVVSAAPRPVVVAAAPRPVVVAQQPISQVKTAGGLFGRRLLRRPQMVYVDGSSKFLGIDIIGGSRIGDPRFGYSQLPISTSRFATLGSLGQASIEAGPTLLSPAAIPAVAKTIGGPIVSGPFGVTAVAGPAAVVGPSKIGGLAVGGLTGIGSIPTKIVTQEEVVGPAGDPQIITTITGTDSNRLVGGKIGGPVVSGPLGLAGIGQSPVTKTVTQEEVVGPLGDSQIVTTVTQSEPSAIVGPSKIGGLATGGLAGIGGPAILQQQQLLSPINGLGATSQLVQEIAQDPIESTLLGGNLITNPLSQALVDPVGPVGLVSQSPVGDSLLQQNIADSIVQQAISPSLGGLRFSPRMSFLSNYPYDMPATPLLRSVISNPLVQQQQEVEQILVKK